MTCNGVDVLSAHLAIPALGPWTAELVLDGSDGPTSPVTLAEDGGLSLVGVVARGGMNPALLRWEGVLVGGAGGLARPVIGAYQQPQLGDVLRAICEQAGETLSGTVDAALLGLNLAAWTLGQSTAAAALDAIAGAAAVALGAPVTWRTLPDGSIWMGQETWPAASLPAGDEVVDPSPLTPFNVIAARVASLLPGVDLAGVGRVTVAEHWIEPDGVRTWAWTDPDAELAIRMRRLVRAALLLDPARTTPQIDRLARYRATVVACATDGSTVDVEPADARIERRKGVPVVTGLPGVAAVVQPGAIVWVGWEAGDPARMRAVPDWEAATVTKMIFAGLLFAFGAETGSQFVALANKVSGYFGKIEAAVAAWVPAPNDGGAALRVKLIAEGIGDGTGFGSDVAATRLKAQ